VTSGRRPGAGFAADVATQSNGRKVSNQFQVADEVGFDWVTVAEHHYAPFSLNPKSDGDGAGA